MNAAWITTLTFMATALLVCAVISVVYDSFFRYRWMVADRLGELSRKGSSDTNTSILNLKHLQKAAQTDKASWRSRLEDLIAQAGLDVSVSYLAGLSLVLGLGLGSLVVSASQLWWAAPLGLIPGLLTPIVYVRFKRNLRMRRLVWQLPEAFDMMGRAVQAGQTVPAAFQLVADDFEPPISDEFRRCYDQQQLGMSHDAALRGLARRTGVMELRILVVALLVQSRSGGNLIDLLKNLSTMVRTRLKLHQKLRALTGEGRMQAAVLIVLPTLAFAALLVLSPDYVTTLTERPGLLVTTVSAQLLGAIWIRRIVSFEV